MAALASRCVHGNGYAQHESSTQGGVVEGNHLPEEHSGKVEVQEY